MDIAFFSAKPYEAPVFEAANRLLGHRLRMLEPRLTPATAALAAGSRAVCVFVNDEVNRAVLEALEAQDIRLVALRCSGFNNVDLAAAEALGITVARVPEYSPHAVAEHAVALILGLNRHLYRAYNRVREGNFALDGLMGFDLHGKTVGVVGTGRIGQRVAAILSGFGCRILAHDPVENPEVVALGAYYEPMDRLLEQADILTLHCPLTPETRHMIDADSLAQTKPGVMLINTSRGALVDTQAVVKGLKSGHIGSLGLDVYEEEADLFFEDLSDQIIRDDVFARLLTFPNVLITGHQAFFTAEAMAAIARVTMDNVDAFAKGRPVPHPVSIEKVA